MSHRHHPRAPHGGRHELGQNFLVDRSVIQRMVRSALAADGQVLELAPGDGALTVPLDRAGRRVTAIELDPRTADRLARRTSRRVTVVQADALRARWPDASVLVANVPFHITTALLRRILADPRWKVAVLLVQWEVARRRAGVGGASLLTAQWWPWYEFHLRGRVPAGAFRPVPSVDGGILEIRRRGRPLLAWEARWGYQAMVRADFTRDGRGAKARSAEEWVRRFSRGRSRPR